MRRALTYSLIALAVLTCVECAVFDTANIAHYRALRNDELDTRAFSEPAESELSREEAPSAPAVPQGAVGWITVEGTSIDYPVAQSSTGNDAGYYLNHDLWGSWNPLGCPFLDTRSTPSGRNLLVYAHRGGAPGVMFNDISRAYEPEVYNTIGDLVWTDANGLSTTYEPLCCLHVSNRYAKIQSFVWPGDEAFRAWLQDIVADSSASCEKSEELTRSADRAVALVTCAPGADRDMRTIMLFAAVAPDGEAA